MYHLQFRRLTTGLYVRFHSHHYNADAYEPISGTTCMKLNLYQLLFTHSQFRTFLFQPPVLFHLLSPNQTFNFKSFSQCLTKTVLTLCHQDKVIYIQQRNRNVRY